MATSQGSELWKIVHNNRNITSNTPEQLWENAVKYFQWNDDNPRVNKVTITSGAMAGNKVNSEKRRPYSIQALCLFCNIDEDYIKDIRNNRGKGGGESAEYYQVVSKILYIIYTDNLEGAMLDEYNAIFTAKLLNLEKERDNENTNITINHVTSNPVDGKKIPELSDSENSVLEKLELELSLAQKSKEEFPKEQ